MRLLDAGLNILPRIKALMACGMSSDIPQQASPACSICAMPDIGVSFRCWRRLMRIIPHAVHGPIVGVREPIAHSSAKSTLHRETGAIAVDMESHVVARAAAQHDVPLAAIRVVVDPVERTIPRSALAGTRSDGTIDPAAVVRSLVRHPRDLVGLIRMSLDARAARATLVRGSALLGPGLGLLDTAPRRPAIALARELAAQVDV